jgi:hypothetical protein
LPARAAVPPARHADFGRLPLAFVPNAGQTDASVRYHARGFGGALFFTLRELIMRLPADRATKPDMERIDTDVQVARDLGCRHPLLSHQLDRLLPELLAVWFPSLHLDTSWVLSYRIRIQRCP